MTPARVLVVDDEDKIRQILDAYLRDEGFEVVSASTGEEALTRFDQSPPDLVVLDIMLPGMDGLDVLRELRRRSDVYVILLTARAEEIDRVVGLSAGADDYLVKPFSPRELVARVKAVLRRARPTGEDYTDRADFEGLSIDSARREVLRNQEPVSLSALEFDLLAALASAPGRVFTRRQLIDRAWGWDFFGDERVVDVHIRKLRRALGDDATDPTIIGTVRGVGYKLLVSRS